MARIAAFLFALAWARGVDVAVENPPGSCMWKFPPFKAILDGINSAFELSEAITHRCAFDPLPLGERYLKVGSDKHVANAAAAGRATRN